MNPLAAVYIFTILSMSAEIGWILVKGNRSKQTFSFISCQLLLNIWSAAQIFQLESVTTRQLFLSYCIGNTGICWIGTAWLIFAFLTAKHKLPPKITLAVLIFSSIMWILAITNPQHHLFYSTFSTEHIVHEFLFYVNIAYTYLCMILGTVLLVKNHAYDKRKRHQTLLLTLSVLIPLVSNILYLTGIIGTLYDITPLAFSVSSILVLLATNRYGFLNVNDLAFDKALESISEGVAVFGLDRAMTYSNHTIRELFNIFEENSLDDFYSILTKQQLNALSQGGETEINLGDRIISLRQYIHTDKNDKMLAITIVASDITRYYEMTRQEQDLSAAKERLAIERERNRIAQEVHDTAGHTLTMINSLAKLIDISSAKGDISTVRQYAQEAQQLSSQGIAQLRISINNLRRHSENSLITDGLEQLASSARGVDVELCVQGKDSIRYSFCSNIIYENTREAITNCLKYSDADRMDIIVKLLDEAAEVYIFDNGKGCGEIKYGNGLRGMKERTEKIGGSIKFSSSENCGFSITMKYPVSNLSAFPPPDHIF